MAVQVPFPSVPQPEPMPAPSMTYAPPSPEYAAIFSAALAAATTAALQNGISVLTPLQTAAIAAAAAAAASEALKQQDQAFAPVEASSVQPRTTSVPIVSPATLMRNEIKKFKKGFSSSPALLAYFDEEDDQPLLTEWVPEDLDSNMVARPRADSEPGLKVTEKLMEEIRKLWQLGGDMESSSPVMPLLAESTRFLSASHATLDGFNLVYE